MGSSSANSLPLTYALVSTREYTVSYGDRGEIDQIEFEVAPPSSKMLRQLNQRKAISAGIVITIIFIPVWASVVYFSDQILPYSHMRWMAFIMTTVIPGFIFVTTWQSMLNNRTDILLRSRKQFCCLSFEASTVRVISHGPYGSLDLSIGRCDIVDARINSDLFPLEADIAPTVKAFATRWMEIYLRDGRRIQILPDREPSDMKFVQNALMESTSVAQVRPCEFPPPTNLAPTENAAPMPHREGSDPPAACGDI
jgi:hypothetical protein